MDPATLPAMAIAAALPALVKEAAKSAAGEIGKPIWAWVKGKLNSTRRGFVACSEHGPTKAA
jgi:hypothetical protein